ncbi:MAG: DsbA family protein [Acetobacteraceae bacterium]
MHPTRRRLIAAAAPALLLPAAAFGQGLDFSAAVPEDEAIRDPAPEAPPAADAPAAPPQDLRFAERALGRPDARVTVIEYFSLTCGHCAAFHRETFPQVRSQLVETGRVRILFRDFPLDQLALAAHMISRVVAPERYVGFLSLLFEQQNRWALARGADHAGELARLAALAGVSRAQFDATLADQALARSILEARQRAQQEHGVNSTPSFVFGTRMVPGNMNFARFAELAAAAGA